MSANYFRHLAFIALLAISAGPALAELPGEHPLLNKTFVIGVGGFFPDVDSKIRLDGNLGIGTVIDFEDELGLAEANSTFWLSSRWRISRRNNLEFEWIRLDRNSSITTTSREYDIGDTVVQAGARIDSLLDIDLFRLTYGYSLIRNEKADLQLQAGIHVADVKTALRLAGALIIDGQPFGDAIETEGADITAPLPHFGGNFTYAFNEKLALYGNLIGFAIEINDIKGSIIETGGTLQYNFTDNIGVGAGIRFFRVDVEATEEDLRGKFQYDYFGPVIYANVAF